MNLSYHINLASIVFFCVFVYICTAQNLRKSLARYFLVVFIESILFVIDYLFSLLLCLNQAKKNRPRRVYVDKPT